MKRPFGAEPVAARLMTWELKTAFEESLPEKNLREAFKKDLPQCTARMEANDEQFQMRLLTSFNSAEGRCFRYLVMIFSKEICQGRLFASRKLPRRIWLYGCADRLLRDSEEHLEGNGLFYAVEDGVLIIAVFFEGRLCHWSEESGYCEGPMVEKRLCRFRRFLKNDGLFGRCKNFPEFCLSSFGSREKNFYAAAKDPFWKEKGGRRLQNKMNVAFLAAGILATLLFVFSLSENTEWTFVDEIQDKITDVSAPSLDDYEMEIQEAEPKAKKTQTRPKVECGSLQVNLQGILAGRLFLSDGKNFFLGDSIGNYQVVEIGRDFVNLKCGDSLNQIRAGR